MQFWPPDDEHMCLKHVEAWNKLIVKQKFCASSWLITEINTWIIDHTFSHTALYHPLFLWVVFNRKLLPCLLTHSTVQCPSWAANRLAASQEIPHISCNLRFITALTSVHHLSLSWASPIQSIYPHPTSWRSILILSTHLRLGLPSGVLPSSFPSKTLYTPLSSPIRATRPAHLTGIICHWKVVSFEYLSVWCNCKAIPLHGWVGPEVSRRLKLSDFKEEAHGGGKVVSPTHRPPYPTKIFMILMLEAESGLQGSSAAGRIMSMKNSNRGIEPATLRPVRRCLNELRHRVPRMIQHVFSRHRTVLPADQRTSLSHSGLRR